MYERRHDPLLSLPNFIWRMVRHFLVTAVIITVGVGIGIAGYHSLEKLDWLDSLLNASLLFTGEGPDYTPQTDAGKIFVSFYGLVCIILMMSSIGVLVAPVIHRGFHKFHLENLRRKEP